MQSRNGAEAQMLERRGQEDAPTASTDPGKILIDLLLSRRIITADAAARAHLVHEETRERAESVLTRLGLISEQRLAHVFAEEVRAPLILPDRFPETPVAMGDLSVRFLRDQRALPIEKGDRGLRVAFSNPLDSYARDAIAFATGRQVEV